MRACLALLLLLLLLLLVLISHEQITSDKLNARRRWWCGRRVWSLLIRQKYLAMQEILTRGIAAPAGKKQQQQAKKQR